MSFLYNYVSAIFTVFLIIFITTYIYFKYKYNYFRKQSIPFLVPTFPLGSIKLSFFLQFGQDIGKLYAELRKKKVKYGGYYLLMKPVILLIHPDIFKTILIKNFNYFRDRGIYSNEEKEFITSHLVTLTGDMWKPIRPKLAPLFSTNNLKDMGDVLAEKSCVIEKRLDEFVNTSIPIESKDLSARIIIEFICSILYGIDTNSIIDSNADISNYGLKIVRNNVYHSAKLIVANTLPFIFNKLNINFIKYDVQNFLIRIFSEAIDYREKNSIERRDLLNLLLKMKMEITSEITNDGGNGKPIPKLTKKQVIAHCFVFFFGGFNTSSTATSFCLYELTQNSDIQNKLREEIWCVLKKYDYKLSYEAIKEMKYLDKVVSETLRKYPSIVVVNRKCVLDYKIPGTDSVIEKGTSVMIPLLGLHHDPEFYPDPEKFDPERFSEDEKAKRHPHAYLPFGAGPRGCIAKRLGLLQTKICLVALLKNYKYNLNPKTKLPLKFKTDAVFLVTDGEIWIDVVKV